MLALEQTPSRSTARPAVRLTIHDDGVRIFLHAAIRAQSSKEALVAGTPGETPQ